MAIKPIAGSMPVHSNISFSSRNRRDDYGMEEEYTQPSRKSSKLKQVPVIVMIAMSPLTTANSKVSQFSPLETNAPKIVMVDQDVKPVTKFNKSLVYEKERIKYLGLSLDDNVNNVEKVYFYYSLDDRPDLEGFDANVVAICPEQDSKGQYLLAYRVKKGNKISKDTEICYIPKNFGDFLYNFGDSFVNNNAIRIIKKDVFYEVFGRDAVDSAVRIKDKLLLKTEPYYANK